MGIITQVDKKRDLKTTFQDKTDKDINVLMVTDVFPNNVMPTFGTFSLERLKCINKHVNIKVVAPVPYFPNNILLKCFKKWYRYTKVLKKDEIEGVEVFHPRRVVIPKIGSFTSGLFYRSTLQKAVNTIIQDFNIDIIDAHFAWPDGFAALEVGRSLNIPVCVTIHGTDVNLMPKFELIRPYICDTLQNADRVIAVSNALADIALNLGTNPDKLKVIHNGVDVSKFKRIDKEKARKYLRIGLDKRLLVSIGALISRKGHDFLIRAVDLLVHKENINDIQLIIAGSGEQKDYLSDLIKSLKLDNHVKLAGSIPHKELYKLLSAADLFCLTSSREGWPTVFFESWACGCPVVATSVHGAPEAICDEKYGLLINEQDPEEIAQVIQRAMNKNWNPDDLVAYANRNTWENMSKQIYAEFKGILQEKKGY